MCGPAKKLTPFATAVTRAERRGWIRRRTARSIVLVESRLMAAATPPASAVAVTPMPTRVAVMPYSRASDVPELARIFGLYHGVTLGDRSQLKTGTFRMSPFLEDVPKSCFNVN